MVGSIIEIIIGWFLVDKVPSFVGAKDMLATIIKIIGVIFLIGGFVSLIRYFIHF